MRVLPCYRTGATPEQRGVSLLPQAPRCHTHVPSAHLEAEEGNSHFSNRMFLCPLAPDWQDLEQFPKGVWGCERTKRGYEKSLLCLMAQATNFSHPQTSACILSNGRPKKISSPGAAPCNQNKDSRRAYCGPGWDVQTLGSSGIPDSPPQRVQCEYSLGHRPKACLRDFSGERTKNQLQFLYTTIYCACQYNCSFILRFLRERDETLVWWKTE